MSSTPTFSKSCANSRSSRPAWPAIPNFCAASAWTSPARCRRLDRAQCHNHPYENWSQDQFWGMAAFFSRLIRMGQVVVDHPTDMDLGSKDVGGSLDLLHPRTKTVVKPALLDNSPLAITPES